MFPLGPTQYLLEIFCSIIWTLCWSKINVHILYVLNQIPPCAWDWFTRPWIQFGDSGLNKAIVHFRDDAQPSFFKHQDGRFTRVNVAPVNSVITARLTLPWHYLSCALPHSCYTNYTAHDKLAQYQIDLWELSVSGPSYTLTVRQIHVQRIGQFWLAAETH